MAGSFHDIQHNKKRAFLVAMSEVGNITRAAEIAEIDRGSHYNWIKEDEDYKAAFARAEVMASERLEQEARRRAVEGTLKPVFHKGQECGVIREYSDTLLIFLLKGALPDKYKERGITELTGKDGGPIQYREVSKMSDIEIDTEIAKLEGTE